MIQHALAAALIAALVLAAIVRAARPGGLLCFLGEQHEAWQIFKPRWLNDKATGGCASCTSFWWVGVPVAALACFTGAGAWCVVVPPIVAVVFELAISK